MGYREQGHMELVELVRRWQAGEAEREVARQTGMGRATVSKYLAAARALGVERGGAPPTEAQLGQLGRLTLVAGTARPRAAPERERAAAEGERIGRWLTEEHLQLTRVQELLAQDGVRVSYSTRRRYALGAGLGRPAGATVRQTPCGAPETAAGEVAEFDFGRLGTFTSAGTDCSVAIWAMVLVLGYSRHCFVWPLMRVSMAN